MSRIYAKRYFELHYERPLLALGFGVMVKRNCWGQQRWVISLIFFKFILNAFLWKKKP